MFHFPARNVASVTFVSLITLIGPSAFATQPPSPGTNLKDKLSVSARKNFEEILNYNTTRGLTPLVRDAKAARAADKPSAKVLASDGVDDEATQAGAAMHSPKAVSGSKEIPVLTAKFSDTPKTPYVASNLQKELFDGPWESGTLKKYYKDISSSRFDLSGTVYDWTKLSQPAEYYTGPDRCNGLCTQFRGRVVELVKSVLAANDSAIDFGKYDNDGPDGVANSGDDDGHVDFVAIVQPQKGGECPKSSAIWSHRSALSKIGTRTKYETQDAAANGGKIRIDDYVIMPAFACDGKSMTAIGVFAHEFGHAFGLPDLYDTDDKNGISEGVGGWDLMGSGSWGGDGKTKPHSPSHMSAWSKEYLGWLKSEDITKSANGVRLRASTTSPFAIKIDIDAERAYLLEFRQRVGFDSSLKKAGLLVWYVDNSIIGPALLTNRVNADHRKPGLSVIEADNGTDLRDGNNRGDEGDVFPGSDSNTNFDSTTSPRSKRSSFLGDVAICNIKEVGEVMVFDVRLGQSARCGTTNVGQNSNQPENGGGR